MISHLFCAISSPLCSNSAFVKTVQNISSDYDGSVEEPVLANFCVDDCLVSLPNNDDAKRFVLHLNKLMFRGGFKLEN